MTHVFGSYWEQAKQQKDGKARSCRGVLLHEPIPGRGRSAVSAGRKAPWQRSAGSREVFNNPVQKQTEVCADRETEMESGSCSRWWGTGQEGEQAGEARPKCASRYSRLSTESRTSIIRVR